MIGKLLGKVAGEVVAAPVTLAAETVAAGEAMIDQAARALERAGATIAGDSPKGKP